MRMVDKPAWKICERMAEVQALLQDHIECGKHSDADVNAKAQAVLTDPELLRAMLVVGYFPPNTPPGRMNVASPPLTAVAVPAALAGRRSIIAKLPSVQRQILKDIPRPANSASRDVLRIYSRDRFLKIRNPREESPHQLFIRRGPT
jgi:hypothetical protein